MGSSKDSSFQILWWMLGLAMTLPMILLSGPLAGYLIGYALVEKLGLPGFLLPVLILTGLICSAWQTFVLIRKLMWVQQQQNQRQQNKD